MESEITYVFKDNLEGENCSTGFVGSLQFFVKVERVVKSHGGLRFLHSQLHRREVQLT